MREGKIITIYRETTTLRLAMKINTTSEGLTDTVCLQSNILTRTGP